MATITLTDKDRFLINQEGQDFSHEAKTFIKIRELALKNLKNLDFPTKKLEDWKYTNLREVSKTEYRPQTAVNIIEEKIKAHNIPDLDAFSFCQWFFCPKIFQDSRRKRRRFYCDQFK